MTPPVHSESRSRYKLPVFELYNPDGSLQLNLASRLTKYLGSINVNLSVSGSHYDPELLNGTPWYFVFVPAGYNPAAFKNPEITFDNGTLKWTVGTNMTTMGAIAYGVYSNGSN